MVFEKRDKNELSLPTERHPTPNAGDAPDIFHAKRHAPQNTRRGTRDTVFSALGTKFSIKYNLFTADKMHVRS
jgi:hypothetical protein